MSDRAEFLIIYPEKGNAFYQQLARRLADACEEGSREAELSSSVRVCDLPEDRLKGATLLIVNPHECALGVDGGSGFSSKLAVAGKRVMVLAEAVESKWFETQFQLPVDFDALLDVGFVSQGDKPTASDVPYRFVFNGPTEQERRTIAASSPSERPIPWTLVGHQTVDRLRLATELMDELDPGGFVFLPNLRPVRKGSGMLGPAGLASVLSETSYYVWSSHHDFAYYESFRFSEALLAGAVPCKIDAKTFREWSGIPLVFPSVESFRDRVREEGFHSMHRSARDFYLSNGSLADHLEEALQGV